jgi:hypothetical protein
MKDWLKELDTLDSTEKPQAKTAKDQERVCRFWYYKLDATKPGYVQMGLMTDNQAEAAAMLERIYGKPVHGLHPKLNTSTGEKP